MQATYQKLSESWALCTTGAEKVVRAASKDDVLEASTTKAKKNETTWGPSHSYESEEAGAEKKTGSWWRPSLTSDVIAKAITPTKPPTDTAAQGTPGTDSTKSSQSSPKAASPPDMPADEFPLSSWGPWPNCTKDTTFVANDEAGGVADYAMEDICNPCQPRNLEATFGLEASPPEEAGLGICRMEPPNCSNSVQSSAPLVGGKCIGGMAGNEVESVTTGTPADRRRQRYRRRQDRNSTPSVRSMSPHENFEVTSTQVIPVPAPVRPPRSSRQASDRDLQEVGGKKGKKAPFDSFTLDRKSAVDLERSISELTMRSSYGVATSKISENRRMAYYAVGKHHRQSGRGGNRRCYFTGKLILGGSPFYAGSVQQGLRTLVVFCLPSSLGLPKGLDGSGHRDSSSVLASLDGTKSPTRRISGGSSRAGARSNGIMGRNRSVLKKKVNAMDEMSLSVGEELDPNFGLETSYLLSVLPDPDQKVLDEMAQRFPQQFETLPVQVRGPHCWRLYVKFCFFSGLPIAEGELHYRVRDDVADAFGEEVILSHEVMEAVNGHDSAEILKLPNLKTFKYLRKHYNQQSAKLPDQVFQRMSWEMVRAEV